MARKPLALDPLIDTIVGGALGAGSGYVLGDLFGSTYAQQKKYRNLGMGIGLGVGGLGGYMLSRYLNNLMSYAPYSKATASLNNLSNWHSRASILGTTKPYYGEYKKFLKEKNIDPGMYIKYIRELLERSRTSNLSR